MNQPLSPHVAATIYALEAHYGRLFQPKPEHLPIWEQALGSVPPDDLRRAVDVVVQHHSYGAPGIAHIKQALGGRWESRKVPRTDCNLDPAPQTLGYIQLACLCDYATGEVIRAFTPGGDLVRFPDQQVIQAAANVPAELRPPSAVAQLEARDEPQQVGGPAAVDFHQILDAPNPASTPNLAAPGDTSRE